MNPLTLFHPLIKKWFGEKIGTPTEIQSRSWPLIADGRHVLMTAPTGTGKTLAAFLWALDRLLTGKWEPGKTSVLYISPLKALNNDVRKNLLKPLEEIKSYFNSEGLNFPDIKVFVRSGDTPPDERRRMVSRPPEILITTPESLNILLTSKNSFTLFDGLKTVILDEIHALAGNKRGTYLICAVERLTRIAGEFQRVVLSATAKPLQVIADWAGSQRKMEIAESAQSKEYEVSVTFPADAREKMIDDSWWPPLIDEFKKRIKSRRSTLLFANSRRLTEKVVRLINENEPEIIAYSHHGSISKEIRLAVEDRLKKGELKAIVATNSLELGIDIGELDQVILIQTPRSISSALQRVGRAGHQVGAVSRGLLFPTHGRDFLDAAVMARSVRDFEIESIRPVECPLDLLAQIILSMTLVEEWDIDKLYGFIRTFYPYRNLLKKHYLLVLDMLSGRYADSRIKELRPRISVDKLENKVRAREGSAYLIYLSGGTIPDRGYYNIRLQDTHAKIGELDEEFVWERKIGESFSLGTSVWRIQKITHNDVEVVPVEYDPNIIPFWKADEFDKDFFLCEKIALFLEKADELIEDETVFLNKLRTEYSMDEASSKELYFFLKLQKDMTRSSLPSRHHLLIEHILTKAPGDNKQVVLHTLWGGRVNHPFAMALSAAWDEKYGNPLEVMVNDDCVLLMLPHSFDGKEIFDIIGPTDIETLLRRKLENTGYFGARFRENAGRALLLPKGDFHSRVPLWLNRLRSKKLMEAVKKYNDFPILLETWRECLQDELDLASLRKVLDEVRNGMIRISETETREPSPFCGSIIWKQENTYTYLDDTPAPSGTSALSGDLFKDILLQSGLRPRLPEKLVLEFEQKLKRTAPDYSPQNAQDLLDWIKERLLIPEDEWNELLTAAAGNEENIHDGLKKLENKVFMIKSPETGSGLIFAAENLSIIINFYDAAPEDLSLYDLSGSPVKENVINRLIKLSEKINSESALLDENRFVLQWLSYYSAIEADIINKKLLIEKNRIQGIIGILSESEDVIADCLIEGDKNLYISIKENLESMLRMLRHSRQISFKALPVEALQLYLASFQNVIRKNDSNEGLKISLEKLFGYPLEADAWEEAVFPARLAPYYTSWLDSLLQNTGLVWFGCGKKKVSFAFQEDLELFEDQSRRPESMTSLEEGKRYSFFDIAGLLDLNSEKASETVWNMAWKGVIGNDSFETVRKGIQNKFSAFKIQDQKSLSRRSGQSRWESSRPILGSWYAFTTACLSVISFSESNQPLTISGQIKILSA